MDGEIGRGCTCRETEQKKISAKTLRGETEREKRVKGGREKTLRAWPHYVLV